MNHGNYCSRLGCIEGFWLSHEKRNKDSGAHAVSMATQPRFINITPDPFVFTLASPLPHSAMDSSSWHAVAIHSE